MFGRISRRDPQERMVAVHLDNGIDATSKDTIKTDRHRLPLYVGIDVGSSFVHGVVVDCQGDIVCSLRPIMHFANPLGAVAEAWHDIINQVDEVKIVSTAFTGSGAKAFPLAMPDVVYLYDSVAIPKGAARIDPSVRFVFHIGAKDPYFFELAHVKGRQVIQEWRTGTKCGGGSGTLIEKQCRRLFQAEVPVPEMRDLAKPLGAAEAEAVRIHNRAQVQARLEEMFRRAQSEAAQSREPSEFLARCGVVIQSDLIHKQNEGAKRVDNLAGLFLTIARNYKIDVLGSRAFSESDANGCAVATGGVMANDLIKDHLAELLGIGIRRPEQFNHVAAIGAALKAIEEDNRFVFNVAQLEAVAEHSKSRRSFAMPLAASWSQVHEQAPPLKEEIGCGTPVVIGIDGGSTTTKGALVEVATGRLLDKLYIKTYGNPEGSLKQVIRYLGRHKDKVLVCGVGATGSARKLYEKILISKRRADDLARQGIESVDRITDEITCHAMGVKHVNPGTDTIFEIGGQDMKFTRFAQDGTVKEAKMNYSCQAGSGQTLENMAEVINLQVESTLQEAALRAPRVPIIDSTCGVFMEMDENRLIAEGFSNDEIAAAIVRGTAASYYYKFVGGAQHVGHICSAQGGPPLGKAFLAALAQVAERPIEAYPHREMFGAWGQALDIIETIRRIEREGRNYGTAFRGWDLVDRTFEKRKVACRLLFVDKTCRLRDCQLEVFSIEEDQVITGGFCPRGNSEAARKPKINYVDRFHATFEKHFKAQGALLDELSEDFIRQHGRLKTIGVKRSTATLGEKGIWSAALLHQLGFFPVLSQRSNGDIAKIGVDNSRTEFCIARKLATGHAAVLKQHPLVEYLFNPSFIEHRQAQRPDLKYCIYTESEGYVLNDVLSLDKARQLNPILHFGDLPLLIEQLRVELARVGLTVGARKIQEAIRCADQAETDFKKDLYAEGDRFLLRVEKDDVKAYVGLGRDYVVLDPEASSNSGAMFSQVRGLDYIPQIFLEHRFMDIPLQGIVENEFWVESVKILKANLFVAGHPNLFGIRMMNFACGPDSLKIYQERQIQEAANKPLLVLLTDAQTNNAPFVTRTEAHERVVGQVHTRTFQMPDSRKADSNNQDERIWLIPFMGNASHIGAAGLRHFGVQSQVLPTNTQRGYELARKHIWTEVCHPLKGVVGDALGFLRDQIDRQGMDAVSQKYLVMLPTTSGPCRFGKYTEIVRQFLDQEGLQDVPVLGPSSETDYVDVPFPSRIGFAEKIRFQQVLFKGIQAADLLEDTFLRFRPYAVDKEAMGRLKQQRLDDLVKVVERGAAMSDLTRWGRQTVEQFKSCPCMDGERLPLVLYIGEIYMRQHDPYTEYVIDRLEEAGLELVRDPVTEWLDYVNKMVTHNARRDVRLGWKYGDWGRVMTNTGKLGKSLLKGWYMSHAEEKISEPFQAVLEGRHGLPKPMEMIQTLEDRHECHRSIEGESPLSTGIAYHFMHGQMAPGTDCVIAGIFHVGPFTCMQESVATAKIEAMVKEFRKQQADLVLPIIHAFFGDSPNPNLDSEIAVFKEQCYQKRDLLRCVV